MVWYHEPSNGPSVRGRPIRKETINVTQCTPAPLSQQCSPLASPLSPIDCYGHQEAKSMLASLLAQGRLPSMPPTFPFYPYCDHKGTFGQLAYEFSQDLCIPNHQALSWVTQTATISFKTDRNLKQFVWRVALPTVGSCQGSRTSESPSCFQPSEASLTPGFSTHCRCRSQYGDAHRGNCTMVLQHGRERS
jgi:hypothetical protein